MPAPLPGFVSPMLARLGKRAFDSDGHLFEPKWDGFRALAFVEHGSYRIRSRGDRDFTPSYPELACVAQLAAGTLLDGEIVVMRDGRADFQSMLKRKQASSERRVAELARTLPACYVVFDLLFRDGQPLLDRPLSERREHLREVVAGCDDPRLVLSEGVVGEGRSFFERAVELGLEGMLAKRLDGPYLSGQRSDLWTKIKATQRLHCAILGWVPDQAGDLKSLIVGSDVGGQLRCVGRVGSGMSEAERAWLRELLSARPADAPLVECPMEGEWVEPGHYCTVSFLEFTRAGTLRAPVFEGLIEDA